MLIYDPDILFQIDADKQCDLKEVAASEVLPAHLCMFFFAASLLPLLLSSVRADTEVYGVTPCVHSPSIGDTRLQATHSDAGWHRGHPLPNASKIKLESDCTVIPIQVNTYEPGPDDTDPCTLFNESDCPFVTNLVLDAEASCASFGYNSATKFMTRVSWPASFPVDPDFIIHQQSISVSSEVGLTLRARNRGRRNPHVAPSELKGQHKPVPFIMTVERLLLGSVPGSMLPLVGALAVGVAIMGWLGNVLVMRSLLTLAAQAQEEARLEMETKKQ